MKLLPRALVTLAAASLVATPMPADAVTHPQLTVQVVASGLDIPWDLTFLPGGSMLYTERASKKLSLRLPNGDTRVILNSPAGMWASGETGLMSVEVAADFAKTREFITCHGYKTAAKQDVRVVRWRLNAAHTSARKVRTLVWGLPSTSGRHGGCALVKGSHNSLYIGTGDAAIGKNAQSLGSGGGKVLRVNATTGKALKDNPFHASSNFIKRRIWTYGHRNVQGLARRTDGRTWSVEQGSDRDDEINLLQKGGNYGWNPTPRKAGDPAYNESVPMTEYALPGAQVRAKWRSGYPTLATSGATFVKGSMWRSDNGALAVTALKDSALRLFTFDKSGKLLRSWLPPELDGTHGRLRGAVRGPGGSLYVTTSNGGNNDEILKITAS
jgi:glucose/arabinose dehydrogenase